MILTDRGGAGQDTVTREHDEPDEQPLLAPVTADVSWAWVHSMSQTRPVDRSGVAVANHEVFTKVAAIRRTATIRRGTRMVKLLSPRQFSATVRGRLPSGFCYRSYDVAALSTEDLAVLTGDASWRTGSPGGIVFGLRWRATDSADYHVPFAGAVGDLPSYPGLMSIATHDRLGPPVLGTGFAPSRNHLIPEFVTADLADLPLPAGASLVAFTPDRTEILLYQYLPEQRAWTRMFGPQWRHVLGEVGDMSPDQEYIQIASPGGAGLFGHYRGELYEAIADPPYEFRVRSRSVAVRYPVDDLFRRNTFVRWRGQRCSVVRVEADWVRLRLCQPDAVSQLCQGEYCVERGVYEVWAAASDVGELLEVCDVHYQVL